MIRLEPRKETSKVLLYATPVMAVVVTIVLGMVMFAALGFAPSGTHIQPIVLGDEARTMRIAGALQDNGFDIRGIRPPTVPAGTSRLRVSITLNSEASDIRDLAAILERLL